MTKIKETILLIITYGNTTDIGGVNLELRKCGIFLSYDKLEKIINDLIRKNDLIGWTDVVKKQDYIYPSPKTILSNKVNINKIPYLNWVLDAMHEFKEQQLGLFFDWLVKQPDLSIYSSKDTALKYFSNHLWFNKSDTKK